jgi:hypothetical protein
MSKDEYEETISAYDHILATVTETTTAIVISDDLKYLNFNNNKEKKIFCDSILLINNGELVFKGTKEEAFFNDNNSKLKHLVENLKGATAKRKLLEEQIYKPIQSSNSIFLDTSNKYTANIIVNQLEEKNIRSTKLNQMYEILIYLLNITVAYTSSVFYSESSDESISLNISNIFSLESIKKSINHDEEFSYSKLKSLSSLDLLNKLYESSNAYFLNVILLRSKSKLLYYLNTFFSVLITIIYISFGFLFSNVIQNELFVHRDKDNPVKVSSSVLGDYYLIFIFILIGIILTYTQR